MRLHFSHAPPKVACFNCSECRCCTDAAFADFSPDQLHAITDLGSPRSHIKGADSWVCADRGSPLAAGYDNLVEQVDVPLGIIDRSARFSPQIHCHTDARLHWLRIQDDACRQSGPGRALFSGAAP
ncbi:GFA family protein [Tateyamaria pelophila]